MEISFKGKRALVTGAGKGNLILVSLSQNIGDYHFVFFCAFSNFIP